MRRLTRGTIREARNILTLTRARTSGSGVAVAIPQPTAQNQMIIANATPAWTLLAAPTAQYQVPIAGADPYTPIWAALTVEAVSDLGYAVPALTLSTANAEGSADTIIRSDASILVFDATVPNTIEPDDAAAAGSASVAVRRDHKHGIVCAAPASPSVNLAASAEGSGTSFARADHAHQLDQGVAPTWTALHTFAAHIALSAATSHIRMDTSDGSDTKRVALCGGGGFADTRGGLIWLGGNEYSGGVGEVNIIGGNVPGGDIALWTAGVQRAQIQHAGNIIVTVPVNTTPALRLLDAGALEYLRVSSATAQPVVVFNEGGADVDFRAEASGQANALFVQGSDGKVGIWASTLNARIEIGGTPSVAIINLPTNLSSTIDAGLSTRDVAGESIVTFGTNVRSNYTGRTVQAKAGTCIRCDTRDQDGGVSDKYTAFHVITKAANAEVGVYTVPFQIAAGAPTASLWIKRAGGVVMRANLGVGTTTPGATGTAKIEIKGTDGSAAGPHVQMVTTGDAYPLLRLAPWTHDNISIDFDTYYDGALKSSDAGSNARIQKVGDKLVFKYDSGVAVGGAIAWNNGLVMGLTNGRIGVNMLVGMAGQMHVDQSDNALAIPVLVLDQADISEGFINFVGSDRGIITGATDSLKSVRVELGGTVYRLALYVDA